MPRSRALLRLFARLGAVALVAALAVLGAPHAPVQADVGAPSWWDGDCDANHWNAEAQARGWTGPGAHRLGASYLNVPVCGPRRSGDGAPTVRWSRPGWGHFEWECVELAMRFMAQIYGVSAYGANGNQVVDSYSTTYGGGLQKIANGTPGIAPLPGDVIAFDDNSPYVTTHFGHAAVVAHSAVDKNGNGTLMLLSQNDTADGWRRLSVTNWTVGGFGYQFATGWLHDPAGRGGPGALPVGDGAAVSSPGDGTADVFVRGRDDSVWMRHFADDTWGGWAPLGGLTTAAPAAASSQGGSTVAVQGIDKGLWIRSSLNGVWSGWAPLGGIITSAPSLVSSSPGSLDVFARGTDNALWTRHLEGGVWGPWASLGGALTSEPAAASAGPGAVDVFVRGLDNAIWTRRRSAGSWSQWTTIGGVATTGPAATSSASGIVDVFFRGPDGLVWSRQSSGGTWGSWKTHAWQLTSRAMPVSITPGSVTLFGRGFDAALWSAKLTDTLSTPASLGGLIK